MKNVISLIVVFFLISNYAFAQCEVASTGGPAPTCTAQNTGVSCGTMTPQDNGAVVPTAPNGNYTISPFTDSVPNGGADAGLLVTPGDGTGSSGCYTFCFDWTQDTNTEAQLYFATGVFEDGDTSGDNECGSGIFDLQVYDAGGTSISTSSTLSGLTSGAVYTACLSITTYQYDEGPNFTFEGGAPNGDDGPLAEGDCYLDLAGMEVITFTCTAAIADGIPVGVVCPGETFDLVLDGSVATDYGPVPAAPISGGTVGWEVVDAGGTSYGFVQEDVQGSANGDVIGITHPGTGTDPFGVGVTSLCFIPTTFIDYDDAAASPFISDPDCFATGAQVCVDFSNTLMTGDVSFACNATTDGFDVTLANFAGGLTPNIVDDAGGAGGTAGYTITDVAPGTTVTFTATDADACTRDFVVETPAIPAITAIGPLCSDGSDSPANLAFTGAPVQGVLQMDIIFDGCTSESNWEILDAGGIQVVAEGTPGDGVGPINADAGAGVTVTYTYVLPIGTYTVNYIDDYGDGMQDNTCGPFCGATNQDGSITLIDVGSGTTNPAYSPVGDGGCGTGAITNETVGTVTVTPGTWSGSGVTDNGDGTAEFDATGLALGDVTVTYSDAVSGCDVTSTVTIVDCSATCDLTGMTAGSATCIDETSYSVTVSWTGGPDATVTLADANATISGDDPSVTANGSAVFTYGIADAYNITVTDSESACSFGPFAGAAPDCSVPCAASAGTICPEAPAP